MLETRHELRESRHIIRSWFLASNLACCVRRFSAEETDSKLGSIEQQPALTPNQHRYDQAPQDWKEVHGKMKEFQSHAVEKIDKGQIADLHKIHAEYDEAKQKLQSNQREYISVFRYIVSTVGSSAFVVLLKYVFFHEQNPLATNWQLALSTGPQPQSLVLLGPNRCYD